MKHHIKPLLITVLALISSAASHGKPVGEEWETYIDVESCMKVSDQIIALYADGKTLEAFALIHKDDREIAALRLELKNVSDLIPKMGRVEKIEPVGVLQLGDCYRSKGYIVYYEKAYMFAEMGFVLEDKAWRYELINLKISEKFSKLFTERLRAYFKRGEVK